MPATLPSLVASSDPWIQWSWVRRHPGRLVHAVWQHTYLTGVAVGIGLVIALPLAVIAFRHRRAAGPILGVTGVIYTIPSLALLGFLVPITGIGTTTAEIALVGYTLLILVRNALAGLDGVPSSVREAAKAMGFGKKRQLLRVEFPLALPAIMAGVRIATVTTIGLVTVAALIGAGGLGQLINDGLVNDFRTEAVLGAAGSVLLAAVADGVLLGAERLMTPWARRRVI